MPQADLCLFEAGLAELMEVTRRLDGIHAIDQMYSRLASGQRPAGPDTGDRYLHGLVHFLLGHVARYAEAFDLAVDRYERARRWFTDCSSMNCRLEDRHASYSIAMCQLKSGKLDAASGTLVAFEDLDDPVIMVFVRGLFAYVRAAIHLARDELAHAEASVAASLEFFKRFQSYSYGARAQLLLAWINLLAGHADQARSIFGELVGRTELPKTHIGRAECGYALCMDDSSAETARYFNGGLGKLLRGSWLRVFPSASTAHLGHSGGQER